MRKKIKVRCFLFHRTTKWGHIEKGTIQLTCATSVTGCPANTAFYFYFSFFFCRNGIKKWRPRKSRLYAQAVIALGSSGSFIPHINKINKYKNNCRNLCLPFTIAKNQHGPWTCLAPIISPKCLRVKVCVTHTRGLWNCRYWHLSSPVLSDLNPAFLSLFFFLSFFFNFRILSQR